MGAVLRYLLGLVGDAIWPQQPWATAVINVTGCLVFGLVHAYGAATERWPAWLTTALLVGCCGAFTTFSSFVGDCHRLWQQDRLVVLFANVMLQNLAGFAALVVGLRLGARLAGAGD